MSMFKRMVVIFVSMFALSVFMTILINHDMYFHINKTKLYVYSVIAFIFLFHNSLMLAREVSTKYFVIEDEELSEKLNEKSKGSDKL